MKNAYAQTNIRMPKPLIRDLKKRAAEKEVSLAELVREISTEYLNTPISTQKKKRDTIWNLPKYAIKTGKKSCASDIDKVVYGLK